MQPGVYHTVLKNMKYLETFEGSGAISCEDNLVIFTLHKRIKPTSFVQLKGYLAKAAFIIFKQTAHTKYTSAALWAWVIARTQ